MVSKLEEKIFKEFASKYDYLPGEAKYLVDFIRSLHDFTRRVGGTQYYSEELNKKILLFGLDVETVLLEAEDIRLDAEWFYSQVGKTLLAGRKPLLDKKEVEEFKENLSRVRREAKELHSRAIGIAAEVKELKRRS